MYAINVDVALHRGGRWLLMVRGAGEAHAAGQLSLVGGTVEVSEPGSDMLEETGRREVAEEVGVDLTGVPLVYVESTFFTTDDGEPVINTVFAAQMPADAEPAIIAPDEVAALRWSSLPELQADDTCPAWTAQSLRSAEATLHHASRNPVSSKS
ncbi:NUDIX hydrolase [Streptomyces griseoluteus]|uniref:NUDIX hydrolase n=1 Tax=Streptomyces griseoluteus TaxID=29306 RepID=UPI003694BF49